jgi:hypothetical protein
VLLVAEPAPPPPPVAAVQFKIQQLLVLKWKVWPLWPMT